MVILKKMSLKQRNRDLWTYAQLFPGSVLGQASKAEQESSWSPAEDKSGGVWISPKGHSARSACRAEPHCHLGNVICPRRRHSRASEPAFEGSEQLRAQRFLGGTYKLHLNPTRRLRLSYLGHPKYEWMLLHYSKRLRFQQIDILERKNILP